MAIERSTLIAQLKTVFHTYGYDGASLTLIAQATGLGKGSLYHHFPNGKSEMAAAVLQAEGVWFQSALDQLRQAGDPAQRIAAFAACLQLNDAEKNQASTLDIYSMGEARSLFGTDMALAVQEWIDALEALMAKANISAATAQRRARHSIAKIEGARLMCRCLNDWQIFDDLLAQLPQELLQPDDRVFS